MDQMASTYEPAGGEIGRLLRSRNAANSLGYTGDWPPEQVSAVQQLLAGPGPSLLAWGVPAVYFYNDAFVPLLGSAHPAALGASPPRTVDAGMAELVQAIEVFSARSADENRAQPLGSWFIGQGELAGLDFHLTRCTNTDGEPVGVFVLALDKGGQAAEARRTTRQMEAERKARNTMALVRSLVTRTSDITQSGEDFANHLAGRIDAIARLHSMLARDHGRGVGLAELVATELYAHGDTGAGLDVDGPETELSPRVVETLGLVVHELTVNAIKFGGLSTPEGNLGIRWEFAPELGHNWVQLRWVETGMSVVSRAPRRRGFGWTLVEETLSYELGGEATLTLGAGRFECLLSFPARI